MKQRLIDYHQAIKKCGAEAVLICDPANILYLSGFNDAQGFLLISRSCTPTFFTNFLYSDAARKITFWNVIAGNKPISAQIAEFCQKQKITKLNFESSNMMLSDYTNLAERINAKSIKLTKMKSITHELRSIKTAEEIKNIKKAIKITLETIEYIKEIRRPCLTEQHLAIEIDRYMRLKGDNSTAFATIVASGPNSAFPHHTPTCKKLNNDHFLTDLGAKSYGYCGDLTRNFFSSKMPTSYAKVYDIVQKAQDIAIKKIKPGIKCKNIDKAARDFIDKSGYGKYFSHGLGHGVGLEVHELPYVNANNDQILKEGMVITIEPAIYLNNKFGIRIEDMALVTASGAKVLSR